VTARLYTGDALEVLKGLPDGVARCCVTSPPYWGLRDYGHTGQLGLEPTPELYVSRMVEVFREVRRVLTDDGTLWLNLGDSYAAHPGQRKETDAAGAKQMTKRGSTASPSRHVEGMKAKDLVGIPWMVAFALRADGWYLRSDIIWAKPNPMPESVTDRPTKSHEYLFLLSKSPRYYFDAQAIAEPFADERMGNPGGGGRYVRAVTETGFRNDGATLGTGVWNADGARQTRNARSVWSIATTPYPGAHFATFPPELAQRCILAGSSQRGGCPECGKPWERIVERGPLTQQRSNPGKPAHIEPQGYNRAGKSRCGVNEYVEDAGWAPTCDHGLEPVPDTVLDPFSGSGTTAAVAVGHGRNAIGIELNPKYQELARHRIGPMLCDMEAA
jgi:DNA modification methylase